MKRKIIIRAILIELVIIGLMYLITPFYLGGAMGWLAGFFDTANQVFLTFLIFFILLFIPVYSATKLLLNKFDTKD